MSTLTEIEAAAKQLSVDDRARLVVSIVSTLGSPNALLQPPRRFTVEQMRAWIDEDEREFAELQAEWAREGKSPPAELRP